jgi:hypothetical protein
MAAQNSVADIGVKLTADTTSFETSIERAAKKLRALGGTTEAGGKGGATKPSGGGAGGGTTGAGGGRDRYVVKGDVAFTKTQAAEALKTATKGLKVSVPISITRESLTKAKADIVGKIGTVPVNIAPKFADSGPQSINKVMGGVLSMQYGISQTQGRQLFKETAAKAVPGMAMGGSVRAGMASVVGERRPEVFVPEVNGRILPSVTAYRREIGSLNALQQEIYQRQRGIEHSLSSIPNAMAGTRPMKEGALHKAFPYRRQRNTIEKFIQNNPNQSQDSRDWYAIAQAQARGDMADLNYQGDPNIGLMAAANLSPGMAWPNNRALFRQLLGGVPPSQMSASGNVPGFGDVGGGVSRGRGPFERADKVLHAKTLKEAVRLSTGPKVNPFGLNLTGLDPNVFTNDARMNQIATNDQQIIRMVDGEPKIGVIGSTSKGPFRRDTMKAYESLFQKHGASMGARNLSEFQAILWSSKGRGEDLGDDWARTPSGISIPRHPGIAVPVMRMAGGPAKSEMRLGKRADAFTHKHRNAEGTIKHNHGGPVNHDHLNRIDGDPLGGKWVHRREPDASAAPAGAPADRARDWREQDWRRSRRPEQVPTENLMRFMHVDREVTPKQGGGRWYLDELTEKIGAEGFDENRPLNFYYDPDAHKGLLGDGNHRFSVAARLGLDTVPTAVNTMRGSAGKTGKTPYKPLIGPKTTFPDENEYIPQSLPASWIGLQRPEESEYQVQRFMKRREQYLRELPRKRMSGGPTGGLMARLGKTMFKPDPELEARGMEWFGETDDPRSAGFLTPTGKYLNFSNEGSIGKFQQMDLQRFNEDIGPVRSIPHRAARHMLGDPGLKMGAVYEKMLDAGYFRVAGFSERGLTGQMSRPLTGPQQRRLTSDVRDYSAEGINIDIDSLGPDPMMKGNVRGDLFNGEGAGAIFDQANRISGLPWMEVPGSVGSFTRSVARQNAHRDKRFRRMGFASGGFAHAQHGVKFNLRGMKPRLANRTRDLTEDLLERFPLIGTPVTNPEPQLQPGFPSLGKVGLDWNESAMASYMDPGYHVDPYARGYGSPNFEPGTISMSGFHHGSQGRDKKVFEFGGATRTRLAPRSGADEHYDRQGQFVPEAFRKQSGRWWVPGTKGVEGIAAHEFGHAVESFVSRTVSEGGPTSMGAAYGRLKEDFRPASHRLNASDARRPRMRTISGYASDDMSNSNVALGNEAFAELFSNEVLGGSNYHMNPQSVSDMKTITKQLGSLRSLDDLGDYVNNARMKQGVLTIGGSFDTERLKKNLSGAMNGIRHAGVGSRALKDTLGKFRRGEPAGGTYPVANIPTPDKGYAVGIPQMLGGASIPVQVDPNNLTTKNVREFISAFRTQQGMGAPFVGTWMNPGGIIDVDPSTVVHTKRASEMILRAGGEHAAFDLGRGDEVWSSHSDRGVGGRDPQLIANPRASRATPERILDAIYEGRAAGGSGGRHGIYIVGEIGEELFVPKTMEEEIPEEVMTQIPKAAGGTQVIGKKRNALFAPPEDGWIIPNRLMDKVDHLMPHRDKGGFAEGGPRLAGSFTDNAIGWVDSGGNVHAYAGGAMGFKGGAIMGRASDYDASLLGPRPPNKGGILRSNELGLRGQGVAGSGDANDPIPAVPSAPRPAQMVAGITDITRPFGITPGQDPEEGISLPEALPQGGEQATRAYGPGQNPLISSRGASGPLGSRTGPTDNAGGLAPFDPGMTAQFPSARGMFPVAPRSNFAGREGAVSSDYERPIQFSSKAAKPEDWSFANATVNIENPRSVVVDDSRAAQYDGNTGEAGFVGPDGVNFSKQPRAKDSGGAVPMDVREQFARGREEHSFAAQMQAARTPRGLAAVLGTSIFGRQSELARISEQRRSRADVEKSTAGVFKEFGDGGDDVEARSHLAFLAEKTEDLALARGHEVTEVQEQIDKHTEGSEALKTHAKNLTSDNEMMKKGLPGTAAGLRNLAVATGSVFAFGIAMKAMSFAAAAATPVVATLVDRLRGWQATSSMATTELGKQTAASHGNIEAVIATRAATAGLSGEMTDYIAAVLGPIAQIKAGAAAQAETETLFKATSYAEGRATPEGLYGGYGGLFGGALFAEPLGGGKGFSEALRGTFNNIRSTPTGEAVGPQIGNAEGAGKYLMSKFGVESSEYADAVDNMTEAATGYDDLFTSIFGGQSLKGYTKGTGITAEDLASLGIETKTVTGGARGVVASELQALNPITLDQLKGMEALVGRRPGEGNVVGTEWGGLGDIANDIANAVDESVGDAALYDSSAKNRASDINRLTDLERPFTERLGESFGIGGDRDINAGLNDKQVARRDLALQDIEAAEDRGFEAVGLIADAQWEVTGNQEKLMKGFKAAWDAGDWDGVLRVVSDGIVPTVNGLVATAEQYDQILQQTAVGKPIVPAATWARDVRRQLDAQLQSIDLTTAREQQLEPYQFYQQTLQQPLVAPSTGLFRSGSEEDIRAMGGGSATGFIQEALLSARQSQGVIRTGAAAGRAEMVANLESNLSAEDVTEWKRLDTIANESSATIKDLTTKMGSLNQVANEAAWANQIRLGKRALDDALGMIGEVGGSRLGFLQREQFLAGRASQSLGLASQQIGLAAQGLSLALQKRKIATQLAVAQFQAPGETGEERYAKQREAIISAGIQKKQLGYSEQQYGISQEQYGIATRQFVLAGQIWSENAQRAATDAGLALNVMRKSRSAAQGAAAANLAIGKAGQAMGGTLRQMTILERKAGTRFQTALSAATSNIANFSGSLIDGDKAIRRVLDMPARSDEDYGLKPQGTTGGNKKSGTKNAAGWVGTTSGETSMTVGEAGAETVAILRNPRRGSVSSGGGGGAPPMTMNININNPSVGSHGDINRLAGAVATEVERVLARKGQMLGLRAPAY